MPIPSQAATETVVISRTPVLVAEGVEARRQTRQVLVLSMRREGMVQTTNLKRAAKAEVGSIIPWLQVRILPVPVNSRGAFRVIARSAPFFAPGGGGFEPRMDTNGHEWTRIDAARAFQPEICAAAASLCSMRMTLQNYLMRGDNNKLCALRVLCG